MIKYSDMTLTCNQCGKEFIFSEDEQEFYKTKGFTQPHRCKDCRSIRRQQSSGCSQCGNPLVEGAPVICAACQVDRQLEFEVKAKTFQYALDETNSRLASLNSEKAQVIELLHKQELQVDALEKRLNQAAIELEKALASPAVPEWLEPVLEGLKLKLNTIENNQNSLKEALLQLAEKEASKNTGIWEAIRGFFRSNRRSSVQSG